MNLDLIVPLVAPLLRRTVKRRQCRLERQYSSFPTGEQQILFLGDSLVEFGSWADWFPEHRTCNRGIGGQTVQQVRQRVWSTVKNPAAIVLLVGTNDLHGLGSTTDIDEIAAQMAGLVDDIQMIAPKSPVVISGVLPRSLRFRDRIRQLNRLYERVATERNAIYFDSSADLSTAEGTIRPDYTVDGLHLNLNGYAAFVASLRPVLETAAASRILRNCDSSTSTCGL